jgi:hypothetical protein
LGLQGEEDDVGADVEDHLSIFQVQEIAKQESGSWESGFVQLEFISC